jgi:DNA polymerase V
MIKAGIFNGDILIVDRSLKVVDKKIVIAMLDGDLTVKRLTIRSGKPFLEPEKDRYVPIEIKPDMAFEIWGVVTNVIHKV